MSYALNNTKSIKLTETTIEKVKKAAMELNYAPNNAAQIMRTGKTLTIGVVSFWNMEESTYYQILSHITNEAQQQGYSIMLCNVDKSSDEVKYLDYFYNNKVDGFIFISPYEASTNINEEIHIQKMKETGVPFVIVNGHTNIDNTSYINFDLYGSTVIATKHLIDMGFSDICFVYSFYDQLYEYRERLRGYLDTINNYNLPSITIDSSKITDNIANFKAVVTDKSETAKAVIDAAIEYGLKIPTDFPLIATNKTLFSEYLYPALSTVQLPTKTIGTEAVNALINQISNKDFKYINITPKCELVIRESCN